MNRPGNYKSSSKSAPNSLGLRLEKSLATYAAAAGAAGVGLLASASLAEARVVYFAAHHRIAPNTTFALDVNHDGVTDFTFVDTYGCNFDYCFGRLNAVPVAGNAVEGMLGFLGTQLASALNPGARIGPAHPFSGQLMASTNMGTNGQWLNVTARYLGLKFQINGRTHYGWARLNVQTKSASIRAVLTGYAYETEPNKPIVAGTIAGDSEGSTTGSNSAIRVDSGSTALLAEPDPDSLPVLSLGILALGAQGLRGYPNGLGAMR